MKKFFNMFFLLTFSPWPLLLSLNLMIFMMGFINFLMKYDIMMMFIGFMMIFLIIFQWWRDVIRESIFLGGHSFKMMMGMKFGMIMFILSEIMFFISFFWSYFHGYLSPVIEIGLLWCPKMIYMFNPFSVPLFNTMILLSSGMSITLCHMKMINGEKNMIYLLMLTIFLGMLFSFMQLNEYKESMFMISDSMYGSIFYMLTGFHGIHVLIGTVFLIIMFFRFIHYELSMNFHLGFEFCSWYWHFVDVIWLILYFLLYFLMIM
nr:cytochrome c oxidase subunit 3 [Chelonus munakatae]